MTQLLKISVCYAVVYCKSHLYHSSVRITYTYRYETRLSISELHLRVDSKDNLFSIRNLHVTSDIFVGLSLEKYVFNWINSSNNFIIVLFCYVSFLKSVVFFKTNRLKWLPRRLYFLTLRNLLEHLYTFLLEWHINIYTSNKPIIIFYGCYGERKCFPLFPKEVIWG